MKRFLWFIFLSSFLILPGTAAAQTLEDRVTEIEDYLRDLPARLEAFSDDVIENLDEHIEARTQQIIILDPSSKKFSRIETNAGAFLIAVKGVEPVESGPRLSLQIGNPHAASFSGVQLRLRWGSKWNRTGTDIGYEEWKRSLNNSQFSLPETLESGQWTEVHVDLSSSPERPLEYIECEMDVSTVHLRKE